MAQGKLEGQMDEEQMAQEEVREVVRVQVIEDFLGCCQQLVVIGFILAKFFQLKRGELTLHVPLVTNQLAFCKSTKSCALFVSLEEC